MEYIKDFITVYKKAGKDTLKVISKSPLLIGIPVLLSLVYGLILTLFVNLNIGPAGRFMGIIIGLIEAMLLSGYFSALEDGINYNRMNLNSVTDGFLQYIWSIYFMRFVFFIISMFSGGLLNNPLIIIVVFIILNPAGEGIYLRNTYGMEVFTYPLNYLKDNWYLWIPHVLVFILLSRVTYLGLNMNPLNMYLNPIYIGRLDKVIPILLLGIYFIFRGVLFKETRNSTMRKRKYMGINW